MFSIFHGLFSLFAYGMDNHNKSIQDNENRRRAKEIGATTYHGSRGNEYLVENNKWVSTKLNDKGEKVVADMKTGQIYKNITQERKKEKEKEYIMQGKTVRPKMYNECKNNYYGKYKQMYGLIDIASNVPVKEVYINNISFYISLDNAMILRPTDETNINSITGVWNVKDIINIINERQKEIVEDANINKNRNRINNEIFFQNSYVYIDRNKKINLISKRSIRELQELYKKDGLKYDKKEQKWV